MIAEKLVDLGLVHDCSDMLVERVKEDVAEVGDVLGGRVEHDFDNLRERVAFPDRLDGVCEATFRKVAKTFGLVLDCKSEHLGMRDDVLVRGHSR